MFPTTTWMLAAGLAGTALAWTPPAQDAPPPPAAEQEPAASPYDALRAEYDAAMRAWNERYSAAETDEARSALFDEYPNEAFVPRFRALAEEHAGAPSALQAWRFVLQMGGDEHLGAALDALERDFLDSAELGDVCLGLYTIAPRARTFYARVLADSPHADARGKACYALGGLMHRRASTVERLAQMDEGERAAYAQYYGEATLAELKGTSAAELQAQAERLFERVVADFGDVKVRGGTLAGRAEGDLFEIRRLQIGMPAPEIEGQDIDGVAFQLSDYRGKVVVLDFWGDW